MSDIQKLTLAGFIAIFVIVAMTWTHSTFSKSHRVIENMEKGVLECGENNVKAVTLEGFVCDRKPRPTAKPRPLVPFVPN